MSGVSMTRSTAVSSAARVSGGVAAGATSPNQEVKTRSRRPGSPMVGTSGSTFERSGPVTASAFSRPACTCGATRAMVPNSPLVVPVSSAGIASPVGRKCTASTGRREVTPMMAAPKWPGAPAPKVPMGKGGWLAAQRRQPAKSSTGIEFGTTSAKSSAARKAMGAKSRPGSQASVAKMLGAMVSGPTPPA